MRTPTSFGRPGYGISLRDVGRGACARYVVTVFDECHGTRSSSSLSATDLHLAIASHDAAGRMYRIDLA